MLNNGFSWFNEIMMLIGVAFTTVGAILLGAPAVVAGVVAGITASIATLVIVIKDNWETITKVFTDFDNYLQTVFSQDWTKIFGALGEVFNAFFYTLDDLWNNGIKRTFRGIIDFIGGAFTGDWRKAWEGVKSIFEGVMGGFKAVAEAPINAIIGAFNGLINGLEQGLNHVIEMINDIEFDVPSWIPVVGGKSFSINIPKIKAPKIPYLATGAVIPPNSPFLAMLGDQKSGTNVEAPLSTIEQAVRNVVGNGTGSVVHAHLYLDGKEILTSVIDTAKFQQATTGLNPLLLG